ncbi:hypothetical protein ACYPKM_02575 [Pseudomonas aeruginosa]
MPKTNDPYAHLYRKHKPCANCPFRKKGGIELEDGRLDEIKAQIVANDTQPFICHKTLLRNGAENGDGNTFEVPVPMSKQAACAGASAWLWKHGNSTVSMRINEVTGRVPLSTWEKIADLVVD